MTDRVSSMSFFFFQAEDGIRYATVTGVQTCALPISKYREDTSEFVFLMAAIKLTPAIVLHKKPTTPRYGAPFRNRLRDGFPTYCGVPCRSFMYFLSYPTNGR